MLPYWLSAIFYWLAWPSVRRRVFKQYEVSMVNVHNIPAEGPVILAANHLRRVDSLIMGVVTNHQPRRVTYLVHSEHFKARTLRGLMVTLAFIMTGQIPLEGCGSKVSMNAIARAQKLLMRGRVLGIHVEGTRSPDGRLYNARLGFAYLALRTEATVVPVALSYSGDSEDSKARIYYGQPLRYEDYKDMRPRELANLVTEKIHSISSQERAYRNAHVAHGAGSKAHY